MLLQKVITTLENFSLVIESYDNDITGRSTPVFTLFCLFVSKITAIL